MGNLEMRMGEQNQYIRVIKRANIKPEVRFNDVHDPKTGRFGPKNDGGGGGPIEANDARIKELETQMAEAKSIFTKARLMWEIDYLKSGFNGTLEEYKEAERKKEAEEKQKRLDELKKKQEAEELQKKQEEEQKKKEIEEELQTQPKHKVEQYKIIQETNPMQDDYHVGIRKPSDIKTWEEVMKENKNDGESFAWGDFSAKDGEKALKTGKITVYSSYPITQGVFVSTSKVQSEQYAGGGKVYKKTVPLAEVAWINGDEGQFAKTD